MNPDNKKQEILILHGWGGSKQSWQNFIKEFDKSKYKIYTPDLPGFSATPAPKKAWSVGDYANHVRKLIKDYDIEKPIVIAHSFGCRITIKLASKYKNLFSKIVLIGAAGIKHEASLKVKIFRTIAKWGKQILKLLKLEKIQNVARRVLHRIAGARDYSKTEGKMRETFKLVIEEDLCPLLKEINTTTHIIWGDKDSYVPVSDAHIMHEKIPNSTVKIIKDGKHGLHIQQPQKLAEIIKSYIQND